ncbi:MAG: Cof-type HAD-IIB family hydrolase [Spirochaetaceae bacterium]|jgi:Cof subfamily protein (haloacid dehalogenase superfamily)|nr:Cof-type HAD-IIB family hydrolase [Spirochaetaceae bacterium]
MNDIKLIAADMDHTLLTEKGELPPNFDSYVLKLNEAGIDFVIASGRPLYTLETTFSKIKHKMCFICDNGGAICYKSDIIFKSLIKPDSYQSMIKFVENKTDGIPILCGLDTAYLSEKNKIYENYLKTFYSKITFVENLDDIAVDADKFTIYFPGKNSKEHYEKIFKPQYGDSFSVTVGDTIWIDIMNYGINKGEAIKFLGKKLGLKYEQMMAFGDTYNDIEMLQSVKYSYIVKNAAADMKQYANFITDSNDDFGVLKVIDKIINKTFIY